MERKGTKNPEIRTLRIFGGQEINTLELEKQF